MPNCLCQSLEKRNETSHPPSKHTHTHTHRQLNRWWRFKTMKIRALAMDEDDDNISYTLVTLRDMDNNREIFYQSIYLTFEFYSHHFTFSSEFNIESIRIKLSLFSPLWSSFFTAHRNFRISTFECMCVCVRVWSVNRFQLSVSIDSLTTNRSKYFKLFLLLLLCWSHSIFSSEHLDSRERFVRE